MCGKWVREYYPRGGPSQSLSESLDVPATTNLTGVRGMTPLAALRLLSSRILHTQCLCVVERKIIPKIYLQT
jgi:hypothetical protein